MEYTTHNLNMTGCNLIKPGFQSKDRRTIYLICDQQIRQYGKNGNFIKIWRFKEYQQILSDIPESNHNQFEKEMFKRI